MSNRETRETSPEISLSPEKIDAWVYSKYKLSTLSYFANLEDEFFENEEVQDFPKEIKISPESWKEMYRLLEKNLDGTLFEQITEDLLPYNADREPAFPVFLFSTLKKYPTFRKLLAMNIQNIEKVQNNTSNILTPLKICQAIS